MVYKLRKNSLGLKQSSRFWYERLRKLPEYFGFKQLALCEYVLELETEKFNVDIYVYVDDLVLVDSVVSCPTGVKENSFFFKLTRIGELMDYLGGSLTQKGNTVLFNQS